MGKHTISPFTEAGHLVGARLIAFQRGSSSPLPDHKTWLEQGFVPRMRQSPNAWVDLIGYATGAPSKAANDTVAWNRIRAVESHLKSLYPALRINVRMLGIIDEQVDENGKAVAPGMDNYWNAVLLRWYGVTLTAQEITTVYPASAAAGNKRFSNDWSIAAAGSIQNNPLSSASGLGLVPAQFALGYFKFRNNKTMQIHKFISPMCGAGMSYDILKKLVNALKLLPLTSSGPSGVVALTKLAGLSIQIVKWEIEIAKGNGKAVWVEIFKALATGAQAAPDPNDFSKAEVGIPVSVEMLNGATIGNLSATGGAWQYGTLWVYGKAHYVDQRGPGYGTRDFMRIPPSMGTQVQVPGIGAGFIGGPLIPL